MKIIHTISSFDVFGPEKTVINECLALNESGWECSIVNFWEKADIPFSAKARAAGVPYQCVESMRKFDVASIRRLRRMLFGHEHPLIHSHGYKADLYSLIAAKLSRSKVITTIHGWTSENLKVRAYERLQALSWRYFDRVVCVSAHYRRVAQSRGVPPGKLVLVPNGIKVPGNGISRDPGARTAIRNDLGIPAEDVVVAIIGRLGPEKGHQHFLEAAARILRQRRNVSFLIVGEGAERGNIESRARELGIADKVVLAGHRNDISLVYQGIDILAITSLREGLPNVLLEAMLHAIPVVAMAVGGIPEVINNGQQGILVSPGDVPDFAANLLKLVENREMRDIIGENASRRIHDEYLFDRRMDRIKSLYIEVMTCEPKICC